MEYEHDKWTIKRSEVHGVGAFLTVDVKRGELIGAGHMLDDNCNAIGYFSSLSRFHNHSDEPNCEATIDTKHQCTRIYCIKDSKVGDEILVNYKDYTNVKNIDTEQWDNGEKEDVTDKSK
tara:strand:+ start:75 stop:434 length:360 start_codon:yes stop_codon:yes gene_type:complete